MTDPAAAELLASAASVPERRIAVAPFSGTCIEVREGQTVTVLDDEGGQVADFFAEAVADPEEILSSGVTIDCNESLALHVGDVLYSDRYRPMCDLVEDTVGEHDLSHPCCRPQMYDFFYGTADGHPSCLANLHAALGRERGAITPVNLFMHTEIRPDRTVSVEDPLSGPGDRVVLRARMDLRVAVAACSVTKSRCNSGRSTSLTMIVSG